MNKIGKTLNILSIEEPDSPPAAIPVSPDKLFENSIDAEEETEEQSQSMMSKCVTYFP